MGRISASVPDELVKALDSAASELKRSRADIIRSALEQYLEDFDDLTVALKRLQDNSDPALDWDLVKDELSGPDRVSGTRVED